MTAARSMARAGIETQPGTQMTSPDWDRKLSRVVAPIRGESIQTLHDARAYILALSPGVMHQDDWQRAAHLLTVAAESSSP